MMNASLARSLIFLAVALVIVSLCGCQFLQKKPAVRDTAPPSRHLAAREARPATPEPPVTAPPKLPSVVTPKQEPKAPPPPPPPVVREEPPVELEPVEETEPPVTVAEGWALEVVAESENQWTGVTVSPGGRIFVNFPRWSENVPLSVGELQPDGTVRPFPDEQWNNYSRVTGQKSVDPMNAPFVAVQSVVADSDDFLWVLDTGNPRFSGVVPGAARLIRIDLQTDKVVQIIAFDASLAPEDSYLNDVRVDPLREFAYITDSHASALLAVNLASTEARRVLDDHSSTAANLDKLVIKGEALTHPDGDPIRVHADGIALSAKGEWLFWQALTGDTVYRVPTDILRDFSLSEQTIEKAVTAVAQTGPSDGILLVDKWLWLTSIDRHAVRRVRLPDAVFEAGAKAEGSQPLLTQPEVQTMANGSMIAWPDTLARAPDGAIYVTTSQIHLSQDERDTFKLMRLRQE